MKIYKKEIKEAHTASEIEAVYTRYKERHPLCRYEVSDFLTMADIETIAHRRALVFAPKGSELYLDNYWSKFFLLKGVTVAFLEHSDPQSFIIYCSLHHDYERRRLANKDPMKSQVVQYWGQWTVAFWNPFMGLYSVDDIRCNCKANGYTPARAIANLTTNNPRWSSKPLSLFNTKREALDHLHTSEKR